jgi:hypothetical protein
MILKVANPTAEALNHGVDANDLLEAADFYNGRFKGLKQIMLLKTDGVKIHIILSLAELTGVTVKRTYSDFSPHISVFSNFLLNQKKWSQYSQDYRRLLHVFSEPQVCTHDEVMNVLGQLAYK